MADMDVQLPKGSKFGERTATIAVLRELGTADIVGAGEDSEKCVLGPDGQYHLVVSPTLSGLHLLRRQIKRLEDSSGTVMDGPLDVPMFFRLEPEDFLAIQGAAENMDNAGQEALDRMSERGRGSASS